MRSLAFLAVLLAAVPLVAQWQIQESQTTADLRGIDYVSNGVAWASGTNGTVVRTGDFGKTWHRCSTPPGAEHLDFRGIQAFDSTIAIAMSSGEGDLSRLYKTTDACQSWHLVLTNPDRNGFFDALRVNAPNQDALGKPFDHSHAWGYVVGDPVGGLFPLFSTADGGDTWSRRVAAKRGPRGQGCRVDNFVAEDGETVFAASNQSMLALYGNHVLFVTGGTVTRMGYNDVFSLDFALCHDSAHFFDLRLAHGSSSSGAFALATSWKHGVRGNYPDTIVVVGGDYKLPNATSANSVTVNRFGTPFFRTVTNSTTPPHGYRSAVAYDDQTKTWVTVGPNGTDISTDNGRNWRPLKPEPGDPPDVDQHWNAISLPFVVGAHGRVGKLKDLAFNH